MFTGEQSGNAEAAITFYMSLFKNSEITDMRKWKADEPGGQEGWVKHAVFTLDGIQYMASENDMAHEFGFTPAVSLYITCDTQQELSEYFEKLSEDGQVMMPRLRFLSTVRMGRRQVWLVMATEC